MAGPSTVTEYTVLKLQPNLQPDASVLLRHPETAAGRAWHDITSAILSQPSCQSLQWGVAHEDATKLLLLVDRSRHDSIASAQTEQLLSKLPFLATSPNGAAAQVTTRHAHLAPPASTTTTTTDFAAGPDTPVASRVTTEVLLGYYPPSKPQLHSSNISSFLQDALCSPEARSAGCLPHSSPLCEGIRSGWISQESGFHVTKPATSAGTSSGTTTATSASSPAITTIISPGDNVSAYLSLIPWTSRQAHVEFRESSALFKEKIGLFREGAVGSEMVHVDFERIRMRMG